MKASGLRIAFAGTPEFAAIILRSLLASRHRIEAVYTMPDRPAGRGRRTAPSPTGRIAMEEGLALLHPARGTDIDPATLADFDALIVVAFGLVLPAAVLDAPRFGCINVHASLLPRWRGAAPIQRAILAGDTESGISIMQMDAGLDTGDVLLQESCRIEPDDTAGTLHDRLAGLGTECLLRVLGSLVEGNVERRPQDATRATYARKVHKEEARVDWTRSASEIVRAVRAFNPSPVATAVVQGAAIRIWDACEISDRAGIRPGTIVATGPQGIDIAAGDGIVRIRRLQEPGRKPVAAHDFLNAHPAWRVGPGVAH